MRNLSYFVAVTLDGFIAAPDGSFDFFPFSRQYQELVVSDYPETLPTHIRTALGVTDMGRHFDTVVSGFATYDVGPKSGFPSPYSHLRQLVVSTRLASPPHPDIEVISSDPLAAVRQLKAEDGLGIYLCGGGRLAAALITEIDELVLKVSPMVIGAGVPLFARGFPPQQFVLAESRTIDIGVTFATYRRSA